MAIPPTFWAHRFKKKEKRSVLWYIRSLSEFRRYREEFYTHGYLYMVRKYAISRADLKRIFGAKPRPIKNPFYILMRDASVFSALQKEYQSITSEAFATKYTIGVRQARRIFGRKRPRHTVERIKPKELDRPQDTYYWQQEDYWASRGIAP